MNDTTYWPAEQVLDSLRQIDFVAVVGPTAAGKTTIIEAAIARDDRLHHTQSDTSRDQREGERDGVDYNFLSMQAIMDRIAKREYVNIGVGLPPDVYAMSLESMRAGDINLHPVMAKDVDYFRRLTFKSMRTIFIVPPSWDIWWERIQEREFTSDQLLRRLREAKQSLKFAEEDEGTHFIINHTLPLSVEDFLVLATVQPMSERLQADQSRARMLVRNLLDQVSVTIRQLVASSGRR